MNLLVTGGCGFIGSNFIRQRLLERAPRSRRLVNLDLLTYAGNPANLADVAGDPRYVFAQGDIGDEALVGRLLAEHAIDAVVNFAAESHVDRRSIPRALPPDERRRHPPAPQRRPAALGGAGRARKDAFRFLHVSTDEVYGTLGPDAPGLHGGDALRAEQPLRRVQGRERPPGPRLPAHLQVADPDDQLLEQLRALPFSGEAHPPDDPQRPGRKAAAGLWRRQQVRDWLYVEDHARAIWLVLSRGRPGETYNIGGVNERKNLEVVTPICTLLDRNPRPDGRPTPRRSPMSPTGRATTGATRSTVPRSAANLAGPPRSLSRPASRGPSTGTWQTGPGARRSPPRATPGSGWGR